MPMALVPTGRFDEESTQITDSGNEIGLRILLLDRDDPHAQLILGVLRSASFSTDFVTNQAQLIARLQQGYYNLLIMNPAVCDVPIDQLIAGLRQQSVGTEILVLAEASDLDGAVAAGRAGAVDCLQRPVQVSRLLDVVKEVLHRGLNVGNLQEITPPPGYRILKTIATGDVSTVVLVLCEGDRKYYAMKVLIVGESAGGADLAEVKRFFREAKVLASIDHPNVVKLVEYGFSEENIPFIVMEYVEGKPLDDCIYDDRFDFLRRILVAEQIAKALAVVHERGVLHRDIRPCNVLVTPRFTAKLADFGLAGIADSTLTMAREILGGPSAYLSPEAWDSPAAVDERSDIFSLGVLYYELFTRRRPFFGKTPVQLHEAICQERPQAPRKLNSEITPALEDILAGMLAKDPAQRYSRAADVVEALQGCQGASVGRLLGLFRPGKAVWQ
jgi:CheY-like chemotaxis protein